MPKTINLPRVAVRNWSLAPPKDNAAWISINEPNEIFTSNPVLDRIPNLKIAFWDITTKMGNYEPPTVEDAEKIVDFIYINKDKNCIVNCAAGVSRSGAVCKFLEEKLGYEWIEFGKKNSVPNTLLFELMCEVWGWKYERIYDQTSNSN